VVISDVFTNPRMRAKMMEKRMRKIEVLLKDFPDPKLEGPQDADLTLVGYGSTYAVLLETQAALAKEGFKVNIFAPRRLWPFRAEGARKLLERCRMTLGVEANYTGQFAKIIRRSPRYLTVPIGRLPALRSGTAYDTEEPL
jgi:2-oxoglutarate ferredoxin oxidoreductase subunit alpha